jgi:serine/threonine-protein kinase
MQRNRQIGEYTIIKPVGEGRFGICYLATDANSRLVILKRLKPKNFFKDRGKRAHEAIILSHINHPAIPQFLGVVEKNSFYAYVLEQKPGYSVEMMLYKMQHHFSVCATHGTLLDGESPLWGYVATNH